MHKKNLRKWTGFWFILPWLIGFLLFRLYPFGKSLYYSFTNYNMLAPEKWVGLDNYIRIFTRDKYFWGSLVTTFKYVIVAVPLKLTIALMVALFLNSNNRLVNFYRTVYYLPSILGGSVAVSLIWRFLFAPTGVINSLLAKVGIAGPNWLGDPNVALFTISLLNLWQFGASMVLFFAGIRQIPKDLFEAAAVDGIGKVRAFFTITLPMISSIIFFNLIMQMVSAFQEFTAHMLITNGGPLHSTYVYGLMLYEKAFQDMKMGYASALSWILFVIIMIFTGILFGTSKYWTYYEDGGNF